ncbi:MAG: helix-turn-helix domain-containing protein [Panacagrimonas sp.]
MQFCIRGKEAHFEHLGEYVRTLRQARGYTQRQLAGVSGVGLRFLSEFERGKPSVSFQHVSQVLTVLGIELLAHDRSLVWPSAPASVTSDAQ